MRIFSSIRNLTPIIKKNSHIVFIFSDLLFFIIISFLVLTFFIFFHSLLLTFFHIYSFPNFSITFRYCSIVFHMFSFTSVNRLYPLIIRSSIWQCFDVPNGVSLHPLGLPIILLIHSVGPWRGAYYRSLVEFRPGWEERSIQYRIGQFRVAFHLRIINNIVKTFLRSI